MKEDILQLGRILTVWAHPDDETFCCGGLLSAAIENGQQVVCITATKGEAGVQDESRWPAERLGEIRDKELKAALDVLGIKNHHYLGYKDGLCDQVDTNEAAVKIAELIDRYEPDTILTFGPDGLTGHSDHATVSIWTKEAVKLASTKPKIYHVVQLDETYDSHMKEASDVLNIFYKIDQPPIRSREECDICFELDKERLKKKYCALEVMPSQMEGMLKYFDEQKFNKAFAYECFIAAD